MTRLLLPLALLLALLSAPAAQAGTHPTRLRDVLRTFDSSVTVPQEWAGIWLSVDSTYDCNDVLTGVETTYDTLCAGKSIWVDTGGTPVQYDCTGTADANQVHVTCTATVAIDPCVLTFTMQLDGTRTGDSFFAATTTTEVYSGSDPLCDYLPDTCARDRMHATRIAPAPAEYCATPALETSWGRVKTLYR